MSVTLMSNVTLTYGPHWSGLTWTAPVDLLTSHRRHADAVNLFLDLFLFRKFQKMFKTSKIHRKSTVTPNEIIYIWKMIRKIQSIRLYWFHECLNKLTCCLVQNMISYYLRSHMSLNFEPLVQNGSNPSGCSCISPTHSFCHVMIMHHFEHCIDCVLPCLPVIVPSQ